MLVASLLDAAKVLFYFLHSSSRPQMSMRGMEEETLVDSGEEGGGDSGEDIMDQDQMIENGMKEALFECSIQLI